MKISCYLSMILICGLMATSCSNKYEDAISNYVQTIEGTKVDLNFELKEAKEVKKITVADSITTLSKEAENVIAENIQNTEADLTLLQQNMVMEKTKTGAKNTTLLDAFEKSIAVKISELEALKQTKSEPIVKYEGRKADEVLAIVVEAKYKVKNPLLDDTDVDMTGTFALSPDAKVCLAQLASE